MFYCRQYPSTSSYDSDELDESDDDQSEIEYDVGNGRKKILNKGRWVKEEDDKLKRIVESTPPLHLDWKVVAGYFTDRSDVQCQHRWQKVLNPELIKGPWTKEV